MTGAVFVSGKYGSTDQYAHWIADETGLPVFDVKDSNANPASYDFLLLGCSVMVYKLTIRKWLVQQIQSG